LAYILCRLVQYEAMAGVLEFDRSAALDKALVLFWRKGYQAASLSELLEAMDIGRSSFYATFVDKRSLYLECLELFAKRTKDILLKERGDKPPLEALRNFFEYTATGQRGQKISWGCMMVNTVLELAGVGDDLSARASSLLAGVQAEFEKCLRDAGLTLKRAAEYASFLMLFNEGIRVSSRRRAPRDQQLADIETAFRLIGSAV
jgi:TetR/AcrR family transcriptional regulator, transcriptional repressor for nem operon